MKIINNKLNNLQIHFLPYISLKENIRYGKNIIFWDFDKNKNNFINNEIVKKHIEKIFSRYFDKFEGNPLKKIVIVSYKSPNNFTPLTDSNLNKIKDAIKVLCFSSIINNNKFSAIPSDNFNLIIQNFILGNYGIALSYGSYIREIDGGYDLDMIKFNTPSHIINNGLNINFNDDIFKAMGKLKRDRSHKELYGRILTSFEWVSYAYTNIENFNNFSRIVMMSTAFEVLLAKFGNKWEFIKKIAKYTSTQQDNEKNNREIKNIWIQNRGNVAVDYSYKEWWAYEFYALRNKIVHGEETKNSDLINRKKIDYFLLSILFFVECLKKILNENNYYNYGVPDRILWADIWDKI